MPKHWQIRRDNFIAPQGWMRIDLGLKGNELLIYAAIFGFSQSDGQWFAHNASYLAEWTDCHKRSVFRTLKALTEKGLLVRAEREENGVKQVYYRAVRPGDDKMSRGDDIMSPGDDMMSLGDDKMTPGVVTFCHTDTLSKDNTCYNTSNTKEENSVVMSVENVENDVQKRQQHGDPDVDPYIHMAERVIDRYERTCTGLRRTRYLTRKRIKAVGELLRDGFSLEDIERAFMMAQESPFLRGEVSRFHAGIDWILEPQHLTDILEEKYAPREKPTGMTAEEIKKRDGYLAVVNRFSKGDAT